MGKSAFEIALEEVSKEMIVTFHQTFNPPFVSRNSSYFFTSGLIAETKDFELWADSDDIVAHTELCRLPNLSNDNEIASCKDAGCFIEKKNFEIRDKRGKLPTAVCEHDNIHEATQELCNVQQAFGEEERLKGMMARYMNVADKIFPGF